jgi:hypothetical protein
MFNWIKPKRPLAPFSAGNPGRGASFQTAFANGGRTWTEDCDTLTSLATAIKAQGLKYKRGEAHLELDNGLVVRPQIVIVQPQDDGSVETTTTIEVNHPQLCPNGTFEYQHSVGDSVEDSLKKGFAGWVDTDLLVFVEATREKVEICPTLQFDLPGGGSSASNRRQVVLGPPLHATTQDPPTTDDQHAFCPCCLFTNTQDAFQSQLEGREFHGIRLFAARDTNGIAQADCRVNGLDWAPGAAALLKYVATWPDRGFEYRKQFVAIRTVPA